MTRVLIIGGQTAARRLLRQQLEAERDIEIVRELGEAGEGLRLLREAAPDLIAIDAHALSVSGLRLIEEIMSEMPLPIIILSDLMFDADSSAVTQALRRGALAVQRVPSPAYPEEAITLRAAVRLFARIPVVRHPRSRPLAQTPVPPITPSIIPTITPPLGMPLPGLNDASALAMAPIHAELVGIGSSAGGPAILADILAELPESFSACVLVVQHLPIGFAGPFAAFLRARVKLPIQVASEPLPITPGRVILAPDDAHLVITTRGQCAGVRSPPVNGHRPSVDRLFESMATSYGASAVGIVLSGIGSDGTIGLRAIREQGGLTIAQDGQSAIVNGMPRSASESGAAALCLSPPAITQALLDSCGISRGDSHAN